MQSAGIQPRKLAAIRFPDTVGDSALAVRLLDDLLRRGQPGVLERRDDGGAPFGVGNIAALRVPSRSSVMRFKRGQKSIKEMVRELNLDAIVEGSVPWAGNRTLAASASAQTRRKGKHSSVRKHQTGAYQDRNTR